MHSPRPGLISWLISILLLMILVLFPLTQPLEPDQNYFRIERLDRFYKTDKKQENTLKIIALGSSMTRAAFYFDEEMERFWREKDNREINFIRITKAMTKIAQFRPFYNDILAAEPDLLIVETNNNDMNFIKPALDPLRTFNKHVRLYYFSLLDFYGLNFFTPAMNQNILIFDQEAEIRDKHAPRDHKFARFEKNAPKITANPTPFANEDVAFFQQIQSAGGKVILLEIPRSNQAQKMLDSAFVSNIRQKDRDCAQSNQFEYWQFDGNPELSYYSDMAHLNGKGRDLFCRWFIGKIDSLYHEGGSR